ncbi:hypothetical protein BOO69_16580 [Sulfitobacter alexandrii]|uniref:G domain-containing protein n=1 Tax=Sulfitobacter alexandrii TaxID=1917485 RepID=A0A1J0WKJ3_9RHOB|nr:GTPase [Sulfitobacter alexandrii]APE44836.1 hypothetical protein BOO69_16580 [Sulfitobacter alexandrii]
MADLGRIRARLLRWDAVITIGALALPFAVTSVLGFIWLYERGWFLWFIAACIGIGGAVYLVKRIARLRRRNPAEVSDTGLPPEDGVQPDPDWGERETAAFDAARDLIRRRIDVAVPWADLETLGREVVETVAARSGERAKGALDFTLPEALLLIERVASRFRADMREAVPFSDSVRLRTLVWIWRNRDRARHLARTGYGAWRVIRLIKNPPVGIMQEIDNLLAGGHSGHITAEAMALGQIILLEEVAKAAVDLYSGRLRFSDAELLEMQVADGARDHLRLAAPDAPLRIAVAGQTSAGKSTLINALLRLDRAETDAMATTDRATAHPIVLGGADCFLLDLPGLDGTAATDAVVQEALDTADMVLWVLRANRPARALDAKALDAWLRRAAADPARRTPRPVMVLSCIDTLLPDWPYPEHALPRQEALKVGEVVKAVAKELDVPMPIPVSAVEPDWNVAAVADALIGQLSEALMIQRNRARRAAGDRTGTVTELRRGTALVRRGLRGLASRFQDRRDTHEE